LLSLNTAAQIQTEPHPVPHAATLYLNTFISQHVRYVLDLNHGNKLRAARQLGISRSTLYRILSNESILTP
jgi:DNA-binding NtrC family response regulator